MMTAVQDQKLATVGLHRVDEDLPKVLGWLHFVASGRVDQPVSDGYGDTHRDGGVREFWILHCLPFV